MVTVFILKQARRILVVAGWGRKGDPFRYRGREERKKKKKLGRSHVLLAQWASLGFHQIRVGETGRQGADEDSAEEKPSSPSAAPPLL